jgi:hypothetical protein
MNLTMGIFFVSFPLQVIDLKSLLLKSSAVGGWGVLQASQVVPKKESVDCGMSLGLKAFDLVPLVS